MNENRIVNLIKAPSSLWNSANPVLSKEEYGLAIDTMILKEGDGKTPWTKLNSINNTSYVNELAKCHKILGEKENDTFIKEGIPQNQFQFIKELLLCHSIIKEDLNDVI